MVAIPQISRDRLVSSVVGTPEVDTSGQKVGQALALGASQVGQAVGEHAIAIQMQRDDAEYNQLMVQHKTDLLDGIEDIKKQYASHPDQAPAALQQLMKTSLDNAQEAASNPRVKLAAAKGDPQAASYALRDIYGWQGKQEYANVIHHAKDTINDLSSKAAAIGNNPELDLAGMKAQVEPLVNALGSEVNSIKASKHPELAPNVAYKGTQSILKNVFDNAINSQPSKAVDLANDPEFSSFFANKPDELKSMRDQALKAEIDFPKKVKEQQTQQFLSSHQQLLSGVVNGTIGYDQIDAAQKMDTSGQNDFAYIALKDISLKNDAGGAAGRTREMIQSQVIDDAAKMGFHLRGDPGSLALTASDKKARVSSNVEALYKLQNELLDAKRREIISTADYNSLTSQLHTPLVAATLQKHDPAWYEDLTNNPKSWFYNKHQDPTKVDDFRTSYNIIERDLARRGVDKQSDYFIQKSALYDSYFRAKDELSQKINPMTGKTYTPTDVAHYVLGTSIGNVQNINGQFYKIEGYDPKDGMPILGTPQEFAEVLAGKKNLEDVLKGK